VNDIAATLTEKVQGQALFIRKAVRRSFRGPGFEVATDLRGCQLVAINRQA